LVTAKKTITSGRIVDWSRNAKNKRLLDKAGSECDHLCITDYFQILNDLENLFKQNEELHLLLQTPCTDESFLSVDENPQPSLTLVL